MVDEGDEGADDYVDDNEYTRLLRVPPTASATLPSWNVTVADEVLERDDNEEEPDEEKEEEEEEEPNGLEVSGAGSDAVNGLYHMVMSEEDVDEEGELKPLKEAGRTVWAHDDNEKCRICYSDSSKAWVIDNGGVCNYCIHRQDVSFPASGQWALFMQGSMPLPTVKEPETERLQRQINVLVAREEEGDVRMGEITELFETEMQRIQESIDQDTDVADDLQDQIDALQNPPEEGPPPPGPKILMFIISEYFNLVASSVIIANITTMIMALVHKHYEKDFFWLNQAFMVFYVFELTLKAILMKRTLLVGKVSVVWFNWLDSLIVGSGILDMWVQPLLGAVGLVDPHGHSLKCLSFLRMLRLLRIVKLFSMFLKADLSFADGPPFQLFIMSVIGANSVLMGLESDIPDWGGWYYVEQTLLLIFSFEVACRLKRWKLQFFVHETDFGWNNLDFLIVAGGIVDQWMMPTIALIKSLLGQKTEGKGGLGQIMMLLRMARLLRILRLVRLIKSIPPLFTLVVGIMQAMQGMIWVLVLTVVVLYAFSLLGVKLIGHGLVFGGRAFAPPDVLGVFPDVLTSMFVLFKAMNGDWGALEPLFAYLPITKALFFLYTVISTWGILSILTAVVSDSIIAASNENREEMEREEKERESAEKEQQLTEIFHRVNSDGSEDISKEEFDAMLADPVCCHDLLDSCGLDKNELKKLFSYLSHPAKHGHDDDELVIHRDLFVAGLKMESRPVSQRCVMRVEKRIKAIEVIFALMAQDTLENLDETTARPIKGITDFLDELMDEQLAKSKRAAKDSARLRAQAAA